MPNLNIAYFKTFTIFESLISKSMINLAEAISMISPSVDGLNVSIIRFRFRNSLQDIDKFI